MESEMAVFRLVRFLLSGRNHNKGTGKTRIWEADTVVSGLKRGGSYQFKAVYEPDDKDGQNYYETVTSEAATVTIKEDSSTEAVHLPEEVEQPEAAHLPEAVEQPEAAHLPEVVEQLEAAHLPEEVLVAEILRVVTQPEGNTIQRKQNRCRNSV